MKQYRNELKYCCTRQEAEVLHPLLSSLMTTDPHSDRDGTYLVHSLYFDDHLDSALYANGAGISKRGKYRIRYYQNSPNMLRLEKKEKYNERCYKRSCTLSPDQYQQIFLGNSEKLLWETNDPLLKQFCLEQMTKLLQPKVIVDYKRTAYIDELTNIRITFDESITASSFLDSFLTGNYLQYPLQQDSMCVLEVKFDTNLPSHLKRIVEETEPLQTAFSKYALAREKLKDFSLYYG